MADLDDEPAELSELDLSEETAITGEDVQEAVGFDESTSIVRADEPADEDETSSIDPSLDSPVD